MNNYRTVGNKPRRASHGGTQNLSPRKGREPPERGGPRRVFTLPRKNDLPAAREDGFATMLCIVFSGPHPPSEPLKALRPDLLYRTSRNLSFAFFWNARKFKFITSKGGMSPEGTNKFVLSLKGKELLLRNRKNFDLLFFLPKVYDINISCLPHLRNPLRGVPRRATE